MYVNFQAKETPPDVATGIEPKHKARKMKDELLRINAFLAHLNASPTVGWYLAHALDQISCDWLRFQKKYHASTIIPFIVRDAIEDQIAEVWRRAEYAHHYPGREYQL